MFPRIRTPYVCLAGPARLAAMAALGAAIWLLIPRIFGATPAAPQFPPAFPPEYGPVARQLLDSPSTQYLSPTERYVLQLMSGDAPGGDGDHPAASEQTGVPNAELPFRQEGAVLVNDPRTDLFAAHDATTQDQPVVAGFGDNVIAVYQDTGATAVPPFNFIGYSRSTDGGKSFTDMGSMPTSNFLAREGTIAAARNGTFHAAFVTFVISAPLGANTAIEVVRSKDAGLSWDTHILLSPPAGSFAFGTQPRIAVDNTGGPGDGTIYLVWSAGSQPNGGPIAIPLMLSKSTDGGATFSTPTVITPPGTQNVGASLAIGPRGQVYVSAYQPQGSPAGTYVMKSVDGGQNFSSPVLVSQGTPGAFRTALGAGSLFIASRRANLDVNPLNGEVYAVYADKPPVLADASDIYLTRSSDGGTTWAPPLRINDDATTSDQFFPSVAVNSRGVLQVLWYDRRRDPNNFRIGVFSAISKDGGRTFGDNFAVVQDNPFPAVTYDPFGPSGFIGTLDIQTDVTANGRGSDFLLAWTGCQRKMISGGGLRHDQDVFFTRNSRGR